VNLSERLGLSLLHRLEPERAHALSLYALRAGLVALPEVHPLPRLATRVAGLDLPNPLGLAAGYDKNAVALGPLARAGFGFVEVGAATPRPQPGNPAPRLFRLNEDYAVINRMGFNNDGAAAIAPRLARARGAGVVGINLGANKDSPDMAADFAEVLRLCGPHVDFATVNVSSPNTPGLRGLQAGAALGEVLARVLAVRAGLPHRVALFVKIAPDLDEAGLAGVAEAAEAARVDGIVATNTTLAREGLASPLAGQAGGLSGRPLFARSTAVLARLHRLTGGRLALIGAGGVDSPETAFAKIRAGASAVQLYTGLVWGGLSLVPRILAGLDAALERDGFANVAEAVGTATEKEIRQWTG